MNASKSCKMLTIEPRKTLALDRINDSEIRVVSGCVWITQYGSSRDIVLSAGESTVLEMPTATVMTSSEGAHVLLVRREAPARRQALWRGLLGLFDPRWGDGVRQALRGRLPPGGVTPG